jgi:hypothetical protein
MRISTLATLPLLGALAVGVTPRQGSAQVSATIHLGKPVVVTNYTPDVYGDWHTSYRRWRPTTVYYYDGQWYPRSVAGGRQVMVYRNGSSYFLPPRDQDWDKKDHRYNYQRRPTDDDYNHVAPPRPRDEKK